VSASPYREPGSAPSHVPRWDGQRLLNGAFNLVVVLAAVALALTCCVTRGQATPRLTLADPKSPRLLDPPVVARPTAESVPEQHWAPAAESVPEQHGSSEREVTVEEVVRSHEAEAKMDCWEATSGGGATTASVNVRVQIEWSGAVSGVKVEGDNVVVGTCLAQKIKDWVFPPSADTTVLDVPFKFFKH
jgi:hypothetical protein